MILGAKWLAKGLKLWWVIIWKLGESLCEDEKKRRRRESLSRGLRSVEGVQSFCDAKKENWEAGTAEVELRCRDMRSCMAVTLCIICVVAMLSIP